MLVGIIGASGYSGDLIVSLLARHGQARLAALGSRSLAGKSVGEAIPALRNRLPDLSFSAIDPQQAAEMEGIELWFLALPHGVSAEYAVPLVKAGKQVIDLSADFRLGDPGDYEFYYGKPHPEPGLLQSTPYVMPELAGSESWKEAPLIACPGCYPTSVLMPLVPLLRQGLPAEGIVVNAMSGVSGAGRKATEAFSFCELNESIKAYGLPRHRHLSEIEEQLGLATGKETVIQFHPHLVPVQRGIFSTISLSDGGQSIEAIYKMWEDAFAGRPFVSFLPSGKIPETRHVIGTNRVEFSAVHDQRTNSFVITSVIDNLMKGASGQAVQIFNLKFGFDETEGLF